jgi:flagellar hook-associated protein 3 FlgL
MLTSNSLLSALRRTQLELLKNQEQISSTKSVNRPSDAPSKASAILSVQRQLEARDQHGRNLDHAAAVLDNTDAALADATELLIEARSIASSQVGIGSSADTRKNQAAVIDAQLQALIDIANRKYQEVSLFGGRYNPKNGSAFVERFGGVQYLGERGNLGADAGLDRELGFNSNGVDAFSALSTRVSSQVDLDPQATAATRLADINGAQNAGYRPGSVVLTVDATAVSVDLTDAETLGDVLTRINDAIAGVDPTAGSLAVSGTGFALTAAAGHTITIAEQSGGQAAADLGLEITATAATTAGGDVDPLVTSSTTLASFGITFDAASGMLITQDSTSKVADFSACNTVQDMQNVIDALDLGVRLEINETQTGFNLVSEVSGVNFSVGENGGSTAADLGLRTFNLDTELSDFRYGNGISNPTGDDFEVQLHDGSSFRVDIGGATTVQEVITAITNAATTAGLTVGAPGAAGTDFNIGLATTGNGFALEDGTAGGADFRVMQLGESLAADNLGIYTNAVASSSIDGADNAQVRVESVFAHLMALRDALTGDDSAGITVAGGAIETDVEKLAKARADVGVRAQRVEQQKQRSSELEIAEKTLLSGLQDADLTEVITRFTQLQQQLQASLQVGAQNLQLSLMDFLR